MKLGIFAFACCLFLLSQLNNFNPFKVDQKPSKAQFFRIAVISDLNSSYGSTVYHPDVTATLKALDSIKPDMILCAGDMVAGQKTSLSEENLVEMWDSFNTNVLSPIKAMKIPFGFTVGNHDASPNFAKDRNAAKEFWLKNRDYLNLKFIDHKNFPFYYSYTKDDVFFISWDAAGANIKDDVYEWMESQLNSKMAKKAKLRIVLGHLPIYAIVDSKNKPGEVIASTQKTAAFFKKNNVDLYISGHQHAYYPAKEEGLRLLNTACIGEGPRPLIGNTNPATRAYTIIEIPVKSFKNFSYKTYIPNTQEEIKLSQLPDSVIGFNGVSKKEGN